MFPQTEHGKVTAAGLKNNLWFTSLTGTLISKTTELSETVQATLMEARRFILLPGGLGVNLVP